MFRFLSCLLIMAISVLIIFSPCRAEVDSLPAASGSTQVADDRGIENTLLILSSLLELQQSMEERMEEIRVKLEKSSSVTEKEKLTEELKELDEQLAEARENFEEIATGVDTTIFSGEKPRRFEWKEELIALVKPLIMELKSLTNQAREKSGFREELEKYRKLEATAQKGREHLKRLAEKTPNEALQDRLQSLVPQWRNLENQLESKLQVARLQLRQLEAEETSFIESSSRMVEDFFRTRGLYLFIAVLVVTTIVLVARVGYKSLVKVIPGFKAPHRPFHIRMIDILYRFFTLLFALLGLILVFYVFEDWVLLSLAILFLIGLAWTLRNAVPRVWDQVRLMLNIGPVREGERLVMYDVPWLVERIHIYSTLRNPDLDVELRIPIDELLEKISRPFKNEESWFPCRLSDWVILADGTHGRVVSLSHEMVELVELGGAHKTYQTGDFLAQAPLNLSISFRIKETFGMSYGLQTKVTNEMLEILESFIIEGLKKEGYIESLLNLNLEFNQASDSSLDIAVIADFKGEEASRYKRLRRFIQSWCVDCCTANNWEIPFPQLTLHRPGDKKS